ncbi:MAG: hypothetical protein NTX25_14510, partial [Proteobacteria bacterium]|nr:hypothetical protein [Pseudomonadota bacterium]
MPKTPSKTATVKKKPEQRGLIEQDFIAQGHSLLGIDEVGRGCLAGPVYAACVALDYAALARLDASTKSLIRDSKTLSSKQRQKIIPFVLSISIETAVASASVAEVENLGIVGANFQAMQRAFVKMRGKYDRVLIDGNQKNPLIPMDQTAIIGGDML